MEHQDVNRWKRALFVLAWIGLLHPVRAEDAGKTFSKTVLPVLEAYCMDCHEPGDSKGDVPFLEVSGPADVAPPTPTEAPVVAEVVEERPTPAHVHPLDAPSPPSPCPAKR